LFVADADSVRKVDGIDLNAVSPEYFATMGTRILRGRGIEARDIKGAQPVMVTSRAMANALWPGREALGQCVRIQTGESADSLPCTIVVGIAGDVRTQELGEEVDNYYYLSAAQSRPTLGGLFVRVRGDSRIALEAVRSHLQREMPGGAYVTVTRFADVVGAKTRSWNMGATAFTAFGALALILAAVGLYSVIAYDVAQRRRELGVRMALGADAANVVRLVLMDGIRVGLAGAAIGAAVALAAGKYIDPLLFRESSRDPAVFGVVIGALVLVAIAASLIPAIRATKVDPRSALQAS
jgi:putative ABC transport system permease protein